MSDTAGAQIVSPTSTEEALQLLTSTQHRKVTLGANLANFQRGMGASDLLDPDRLCISLQELMVALLWRGISRFPRADDVDAGQA